MKRKHEEKDGLKDSTPRKLRERILMRERGRDGSAKKM